MVLSKCHIFKTTWHAQDAGKEARCESNSHACLSSTCLVKNHICSSIPVTLDPLQFAYRPNRSTDDAISHVLHSSLTHIDSTNGNYVRLLFIDYSSDNFLTGRPQVVKVGQFTSNSITLNVGAPQGCVLSPLLYSLYTHNCVSSHSSTSIVKFADDTVILGLISNNDEIAYLDEVERLTSWCQDNCLSLNVSKTKELIVDFRKRQQRPYTPLMISGTPVERVSSFKYLCVNISEDLTWTVHIQTQVKKARQRLYHLRQLRKFRVSPVLRTCWLLLVLPVDCFSPTGEWSTGVACCI